MKLLIVSQYFYPEQFRVNDVCFRLVKMGHDVTVLTGQPNYPMGEIFEGYDWQQLKTKQGYSEKLHAYIENINGVKVIRSKLLPRKTGKKNLALNYLSFARSASKTAKALPEDFDKILVFQYSPVTMAIPAIIYKKAHQSKTSLYLYCFDLWPESIVSAGLPNHGVLYWALLQLSKWIYKRADYILISSKNFEKYFNDKLNISGNLSYLPIYAEELFSNAAKAFSLDTNLTGGEAPERLQQYFNSGYLNLVFAGNIGQMQSVETILMAAAEIEKNRLCNPNLPQILFHIVGDGSALTENKNLAERLGLTHAQNPTVIFHGRHPLEDMPKFYDLADAFLVTLKADEFISYTLPGKVQTYMAAGKPLLASINGETASVIKQSGCGFVSPSEDYKTFAENILTFVNADEKERQNYGALAKAYYDAHFSSEAFFKSLFKLL